MIPRFLVPQDVINNVQGFVNTASGGALTSQQVATLTNQVISEMSVSQAGQLNGIQNTVPVVLTQNQANVIANIINSIAAQNPNNAVDQQVAKQLPSVLGNPKMCTVK